MEVIRKSPKLYATEDFISNMPDNVLTNILDRVPLQDAVRTGVLARSWRYNWTMLSQLVFDDSFFKYLSEKEGEKKDYGRIISRVLMHIKGAVTNFALYIDKRYKLDEEDINHWFLFLSNKGVKDITLWNKNLPPLKLPSHLFSCSELKHLKLVGYCFGPHASFHGFPNLLTLQFFGVPFNNRIIGEFFAGCPALLLLRVGFNYIMKVDQIEKHLKLLKLLKLANLATVKTLSAHLFNLEDRSITSSSSIFEFVSSLPNLLRLHLDFSGCNSFTEDGTRKRSPTAYPCLKVLKLTGLDLGNGIMLSCAIELIRCFPNLLTLKIKPCNQNNDPTPAISVPEVDYNTMGPLQIRRAVFEDLKGSENEVCLIKFLLASSPFLKKIVIHTLSSVVSDAKFLFAKMLLKLQRAYHDVDIDLH